MFFVFFALCSSWSDASLTAAMELMFRSTGDDGKDNCKKILNCIDEKFDRLSLVGSWIDFVERAPYNTRCFNHWRYTKTPIGSDVEHTEEDLVATLHSLNQSIFSAPTINGEWPINFAFKAFFGLFLEAFDPLHTVEYFNESSVPNGDDNGKLFKIFVGDKETNLHDYWGTACGQLTGHFPFSEADYEQIDNFVTETYKSQPTIEVPSITSYVEAINDSIKIAKSDVYEGVEYGKKLSDAYIAKCKSVVANRLALAGYSLGSMQRNLVIPSCRSAEGLGKSSSPVSTTAATGWATFLLLLPMACYLGAQLTKNKFVQNN